LLRLLLGHFVQCAESAPHPGGPDIEEIVLDTEVDGSRYLIVRLPLPTGLQIVLSPREQEIARMVARGHHNKAIAEVLSISSWTVCTHLRRIFAKLNVNSRAAMVAKLHEQDIWREPTSAPAQRDRTVKCAPQPLLRPVREVPKPKR
jgi:two-component system nitrate/nitrite response regulator NarL